MLGGRTRSLFLFIALAISSIFSSISLAAASFNASNLTANNSVTAGYARFGNLQLNDAGQAAFTGVNPTITDSQGHPRVDVFFWDGATLKNLTKDISGFVAGGFGASFPSLHLNQKGQIVFIGADSFGFGPSLPYFYNGIFLQNLADNLSGSSNRFPEIVINDAGQIAFSGCHAEGLALCLQPSVYIFNGSTPVNIFLDNVTSLEVLDLAINAKGHLVWSQGSPALGIRFFDGTVVRDLTDDPAVGKIANFSLFGSPVLSDADQVLFQEFRAISAVFYFDGSTSKNITSNDPSVGLAGYDSFGDLNVNG